MRAWTISATTSRGIGWSTVKGTVPLESSKPTNRSFTESRAVGLKGVQIEMLLRDREAEERLVPITESRELIAVAFRRVRCGLRDIVDDDPQGVALPLFEPAEIAINVSAPSAST